MNVYDQAHGLANAIKDSQEYKDYARLKAEIDKNTEVSNMLKDFETKQMEIQTKQMLGEEVTEEAQKTIQDLYQIVMRDPSAAEYLQAQMRFSVMMSDVYKILGDAMGLSITNENFTPR